MPASKAQLQKTAISGQAPNLFELKGGRVRVTYSTSSIAGVPQFHYKDSTRDLNFSGNQIDTARTSLGSEVTVTLQLLTDTPGLKFTLLLPDFIVGNKSEISFKTIGLLVTTAGGLVVSPSGKQRQTYKVIPLTGVAKAVEF